MFAGTAQARTNTDAALVAKIQKVLDTASGVIGVGIEGLDFDAHVVLKDSHHYPMQSVYKFPLAMAVLDKVDNGKLSLQPKVHISQSELDTATWSPMVKDHPHSDIDMSIQELLAYAISKSDNNACDVLFRLAGGTRYVNDYIHGLGVKDMAIAATEAEMKKGWEVQYTNWCTPSAMLQLLKIFYDDKILSTGSHDLLEQYMIRSENSPNRIKGKLPGNALVAHKTGTSNTLGALTAATNDVGIITLPGMKSLAIVVYVSDFKGGVARGEDMIATIAKMVWDHYSEVK
ncbi:MAG: Beta-lactamase [Flavipsychrobacter sp.]|nr:Beta-lactamase [Flavipsychrobacter sp.]